MILPIQKFSSFKNIIKKNPQKSCAKITQVVPYVAVPLVAYMANTQTDKRNRTAKILEESFKTHKPVRDKTDANIEALKKAGYPEAEAEKLLNSNGEIKSPAVKKELKEKGITFKGEDNSVCAEVDDSITETSGVSVHDLAKDPSLLENMSASEISEIDVSMTPELENFTSIPFGENAGEFFNNITEVVTGDLDSDGGIFEMLKNSFLDITDWFGG